MRISDWSSDVCSSDLFEVRAEQGATAFAALGAVENAFARQDASWDRLGVSASSTFPMGMRFVQNPIYAGALAAFQRVVALEQTTGIGVDTLEKLGRINILHARPLYDRRRLIKITAGLGRESWRGRVSTDGEITE